MKWHLHDSGWKIWIPQWIVTRSCIVFKEKSWVWFPYKGRCHSGFGHPSPNPLADLDSPPPPLQIWTPPPLPPSLNWTPYQTFILRNFFRAYIFNSHSFIFLSSPLPAVRLSFPIIFAVQHLFWSRSQQVRHSSLVCRCSFAFSIRFFFF